MAEITYLTWTADNLLRHTVYIGLKEDKPARRLGGKPLWLDSVPIRNTGTAPLGGLRPYIGRLGNERSPRHCRRSIVRAK